MIFIVDRFVEQHSHVLANVNTIKILRLVFPHQAKIFIAENKHLKLVEKYFDDGVNSEIEFQAYNNRKFKNTAFFQVCRLINRTFNDLIFFAKLFKSIKPKEGDIIFLTHIYPFSLFWVMLYKKFYPSVKMIVTIHGEIEYLFYGKTKYEKLIGMIYDYSFKITPPNVYYLFLTKVSKKIILDSKKIRPNQMLAIILPTLSNNLLFDSETKLRNPVRIGHIGSAGKRKNVNLLYEIGSDFKNEIAKNCLVLCSIGPIEENLTPYLNSYVVNFVNNNVNVHLDRETFNNEITKLDYSIFFYGSNDFILRSGAAFYDAIYYQKPLIALRNDFFINVFEEAGNIGYLCNTKEEMVNVIQKIIDHDSIIEREYQEQLINIKKYKETLNLEYIAKDMQVQLRELDFDVNNNRCF